MAAGNGGGGARQGSGASAREKPRKETRGGRSSRNNNHNHNRPTYTQLQERLAAMRIERSREKGIRKELRELKELSNPNSSATGLQRQQPELRRHRQVHRQDGRRLRPRAATAARAAQRGGGRDDGGAGRQGAQLRGQRGAATLSLLSLNVNSLGRAGRELELQLLLDEQRPAIVSLLETELPSADNTATLKGYSTFYPMPTNDKFRLLLLLRNDVAAKYRPSIEEIMPASIWIKLHLPCGPTIVSVHYRQWSDNEEDELAIFPDALRRFASSCCRILAMGDFNLDWARRGDQSYYRRRLLDKEVRCLAELHLSVANDLDSTPTYKSYAVFKDSTGAASAKESILDHLYHSGLGTPEFRVLPFAATDHRPILAVFPLCVANPGLRVTFSRNFGAIEESRICWAINAEELSKVFLLDDEDAIHGVLMDEFTKALDIVAPEERVVVKERKVPLYLSVPTRRAISARDWAAQSGDHSLYRRLRNRASRMVRKDKVESNLKYLEERNNDPKALWQLANDATGRATWSSLPQELHEGGEVV